jgi:hypothetical protein
MIKVYHYKPLTKAEADRLNGPSGGWDSEPRFARYADITAAGFGGNKNSIIKALLEGEYYAVAVVETDSKNLAFQLTNHVEDDWTANKQNGITVLPGSHRSTSNGDLMEDTETGDIFVVASFGFEKVAA